MNRGGGCGLEIPVAYRFNVAQVAQKTCTFLKNLQFFVEKFSWEIPSTPGRSFSYTEGVAKGGSRESRVVNRAGGDPKSEEKKERDIVKFSKK